MKYDFIGDIHGCYEELCDLFQHLGYEKTDEIYIHPDGRIPVFIGDLTDRGPDSFSVIKLAYEMVVRHEKAKYVPGNHCDKLYRYFRGNNVKLMHGLETTVAELKDLPSKEQQKIARMFIALYTKAPLYLHLKDVQAVAAHAGIKESYIGRSDKKVKSFVLYGDTTGEFHPDGRPVRRDWAQKYHGSYWIVYGHTPVKEPRFLNHTVNIDTGCVFGNKLTAFRLPEETTISVPSRQAYDETRFNSFPE
ncbi:bis(5'-nucleosyl)-tetraphosphatase PrpE [Aciduricibacillus chroicocephali]|uniref:Bis(5'-nucleosyl)-tetraphosphatase PrpE n=1 Tax=Aciduricibacillus chroicocephali TaxID=3054939 RepID=A0ABY9KXU9_9BACI|nr:bis(5'-nucleosyl)-tetraphosphatase PrpE [Bacillaceae bacterium 44XB]